MLELAEASFRSSALGTDSDPGPVEVPLVDLLGSLSMGTGSTKCVKKKIKLHLQRKIKAKSLIGNPESLTVSVDLCPFVCFMTVIKIANNLVLYQKQLSAKQVQ